MSRKLIYCLMFTLPLAVLFLTSILMLHTTGELTPFNTLVGYMEKRTHVIIGKEYIPDHTDIKDMVIDHTPMRVTVLGNSRAYPIRQEFFTDEKSFFNFAQAGNVNDLGAYLDRLKENDLPTPAVVIMILDQYFMLDGPSYHLTRDGVGKTNWLVVFQATAKDILTGKLPLRLLRGEASKIRYVGARASVLHSGFRTDGSYSQGDLIPDWHHPKHEDYEFAYSIRMHERGLNNYRHAETPSPIVMKSLEEALAKAARLDVHVVIVLPSFAPTLYERMAEKKDLYRYMEVGSQELQAMTSENGHAFFDLTDPNTLGLTDNDFYDSIHGDERSYARMLLYIAETNQKLRQYLAIERIKTRLQESTEPHHLFGVAYDR